VQIFFLPWCFCFNFFIYISVHSFLFTFAYITVHNLENLVNSF
jgi:hypothetical protein